MGESAIKKGMYYLFFKRGFDIIFSFLGIVCFCWLYAIVALLVKVNLGSPVIFKQERPGKNGKIFSVYKFRSMTEEKDSNGNLLPAEKRLTKFGLWIRETSLDEIPQLFNILKGDMSFIGPRPLAVRYLPYYTENEMHRHDVRPGISGLAQVNGRNTLTWEQRFEYDIEYVNNLTLLMDLKILFLTIVKVLKKSDVDIAESGGNDDFAIYRQNNFNKS